MSHSICYSGHHQQRRITNAFIDWYVPKYIGQRYKLDFNIITKGCKREGIYGEMGVLDELYRPRLFEIVLHSGLSKWDYLVTLAHEMVHVRQRVFGEYVTKYDKNYWLRERVPSSVKYEDEPWEIDAQRWERYLAIRSIEEGVVTGVTPE